MNIEGGGGTVAEVFLSFARDTQSCYTFKFVLIDWTNSSCASSQMVGDEERFLCGDVTDFKSGLDVFAENFHKLEK